MEKRRIVYGEYCVFLTLEKCMNFQIDIQSIIRCKDWETEKETREFKGNRMKRKGMKARQENWPGLIIRPRIGWSPPPGLHPRNAKSLPFCERQGPIGMSWHRRPCLHWVPILDHSCVFLSPELRGLWRRMPNVFCFSRWRWLRLWGSPNPLVLCSVPCGRQFPSGTNCLFLLLFCALGISGK